MDRDLYGTVVPVVDSEGKQVMLNDGDRSRVKVQLDRSKSRLRAKLVDGDVIQIGNESVNRLRLTIYKGELGILSTCKRALMRTQRVFTFHPLKVTEYRHICIFERNLTHATSQL